MKIRRVLWVLLAALAITLPLQLYRITHEQSTEISAAILLAVVLCFGSSFIMAVVGLSGRKYPNTMPKNACPMLGIMSLLTAFTVGAQNIRTLLFFGDTAYGGTLGVICCVAGIFSAFVILYFSACCFQKPKLSENMPLLFMLPAVWLMLRAVVAYYDDVAAAKVDIDICIEAFSRLLFMLFSVLSAKFVSGVKDNSGKWMFAIGGSAILFTLFDKLPQMLLGNFLGAADVMLALTSIVFLFAVSAKKQKKTKAPVASTRRAEQRNMQYRTQIGTSSHSQQRQTQQRQQADSRPNPEHTQAPTVARQCDFHGEDRYTSMGAGYRVTDRFEVRDAQIRHAASTPGASEAIAGAQKTLHSDTPERAYLPTADMYTPPVASTAYNISESAQLIPTEHERVPIERTLDYGEAATIQELSQEKSQPVEPIEEPAAAPKMRNVSRASGKLSARF